MKTKTTYECEICGRISEDKAEIKVCEAQKSAQMFPVGMIYGHHLNAPKAMYSTITFAIASCKPYLHHRSLSSWACRDGIKFGDSLGDWTCGDSDDIFRYQSQIDHTQPHFKRMVAWLQSQNIPVTVWNGEKPVPLEEWLNSSDADNYKKPLIYDKEM